MEGKVQDLVYGLRALEPLFSGREAYLPLVKYGQPLSVRRGMPHLTFAVVTTTVTILTLTT